MSTEEKIEIKSLLTATTAFINTMHAVQADFGLAPTKDHIATCINYSDLIEMRDEFVRELKNTVTTFCYSEQKQEELVEVLKTQGRDTSAAWNTLNDLARKKFRKSDLRGQFSELLLCNLLQHYFHAAPLVRKMPITTNPALERNGADAIHIAEAQGKHILYLGEAKTYDREKDALKSGLVDSIRDIVEHHKGHRSELDLYIFEDFLPKSLENLARDYLAGKVNLEVHLVCIVTYDCKATIGGKNAEERLASVIQDVVDQTIAIKTHPVFSQVDPDLLPRLNYIIFPIQEMDALITKFATSIAHV